MCNLLHLSDIFCWRYRVYFVSKQVRFHPFFTQCVDLYAYLQTIPFHFFFRGMSALLNLETYSYTEYSIEQFVNAKSLIRTWIRFKLKILNFIFPFLMFGMDNVGIFNAL